VAEVELANHPEYIENKDFYERASDFYLGDQATMCSTKYIVPYLTETSGDKDSGTALANRIARSVYVNDVAPIILQHKTSLAQAVTINGFEGGTLDVIKEDVTGYGDTPQEMYSRMLEFFLVHGRVGILVEGPGDVSDNVAEAIKKGERSYQLLYSADKIRYWELFSSGPKKGKLSDLLLFEGCIKEDKEEYYQFRRYYFEGTSNTYSWQILQTKKGTGIDYSKPTVYEVINGAPGELEEIPFTIFGRGRCDSALKDLIQPAWGAHNRLSVLSSINYNQGFQRSIVAGVNDGKELQKVGEAIITVIRNENAKVTVIPAGVPDAVETEWRAYRQIISRIGLLQYNQLMDDTRQVQSSESKAKDLRAREVYYDDIIAMFEKKLSQVYKHHAMFEGQSPDEVSVTISRDFDLTDTELELQSDSALMLWANRFGDAGVKIQKAILEKYVSELRILPAEGQTEDARRLELLDAIRNASVQADQQQQNPLFQRTSIVDRLNGTNGTQTNGAGTA
jgi:hypothetical protein